jgi:membrane associated rhomboid family serine protease
MAVCYRHPNRDTGVACSSCGRPICPDCMTPTPVGMRCPECARQRTRVTRLRDATTDPVLTYALIAINTIVWLASAASGASVSGGSVAGKIDQYGALIGSKIAAGEYWRLVTSGFLHAGLLHLLFNMYALYVLGQLLEPAIGRLRFGVIYFVSLLAGSFGAVLLQPNELTVGASGAIVGLLGAAFVYARGRGARDVQRSLGIWIVFLLAYTFAVPHIAVGGHVGGLIGGTLTALAMFELPRRIHVPALATYALAIGLGAASVIGAITVAG